MDLHEAPEIQSQIERYGADVTRFAGGQSRQFDLLDDNPFYVRDYSQCVMCWRCIQVCAEDVQYTYALTWGGRGLASHVATFFDEDMPDTTCVFCGNCVGVCPTGALKGKVEACSGTVSVVGGRVVNWNCQVSSVRFRNSAS